MFIDLIGMEARALRAKTVITVLYREGGSWSQEEIAIITTGLMTEIAFHQKHPEHILILGRYENAQISSILATLGGYTDFTNAIVTGQDNPALPFKPTYPFMGRFFVIIASDGKE